MNLNRIPKISYDTFIKAEVGYILWDLHTDLSNLLTLLHPDHPARQSKKCTTYVDYAPIITAAIRINDSFITLINARQHRIAFSLIRMQLDSLRYLYAEYLLPYRILNRTIIFGEEPDPLNSIKVKDRKDLADDKGKLKPSEINKRLNKHFIDFSNLYKHYNKYVHPSYELSSWMDLCNKDIERGISDMLRVNRYILTILGYIRKNLINQVREAGKLDDYIKKVKDRAERRRINQITKERSMEDNLANQTAFLDDVPSSLFCRLLRHIL